MKHDKLFKHLSIGLFALITAILMVATIMEKLYGTEYALGNIYRADWMIALWSVATLSAIVYILQHNLQRQPVTLCLHLAFAVILLGAFVTHTTGKQGQTHLRVGEYTNQYVLDNDSIKKFPFSISLHDFEVTRYAGTDTPMDFVSTIVIYDNERIEGTVSMNNILKHRGYRFYQSGYDNDEQGTFLAVSHDPWGIGITYAGYSLLLLSMILFFVQPDSRFRTALRKGRNIAIILLMLFVSTTSSARNTQQIPAKGNAIALLGTNYGAEALYNSMSNNRPLAITCLATGTILFVLFCINRKENRTRQILASWIKVIAWVTAIYLSLQIALRWHIGGHIPLSNGYETMVFMAWLSILMTPIAGNRVKEMLPFGYIVCGLALLVSTFGDSTEQIAPLAPVLRSPLLSIHVVVIMISYTLLAFTMLNGIAAVAIKVTRKNKEEEIAELQRTSILMLYPAVFLLTAGIFIGAVWANVSWGRYWGWDPKEVWALITLLVYSATLHSGSIKAMRRPMFFHIYCIVAFLTVLITYFGVNFILGGMHSYA
jgi:cytochrome c-type biogenesis protein CcsB